MKIFEVRAEGDKMYFRAENLESAKKRLFEQIGEIPESLTKWKELSTEQAAALDPDDML